MADNNNDTNENGLFLLIISLNNCFSHPEILQCIYSVRILPELELVVSDWRHIWTRQSVVLYRRCIYVRPKCDSRIYFKCLSLFALMMLNPNICRFIKLLCLEAPLLSRLLISKLWHLRICTALSSSKARHCTSKLHVTGIMQSD